MRRCVELASAGRADRARSSAFRHRSSAINTAIRRSVRAGIAVTAGAVLFTAGLTACGTVKELSAGEKLSGAFDKLGDAKAITFQLSTDATADQLVAFGKAVDDPIEQKDAEQFADLQLSVSMSADKPLKDTEAFKGGATDPYDLKGVAVAYSLGGKKSGKNYADIRMVGDKMYFKTDFKALAGLGGEDTGDLDQLADQLPAEAGPLKDVFAGKWVSMDLKKMRELGEKNKASSFGAGSPLGAMPSFDPSELERFGKSVKAVLSKNTTFEAKGKSGDADVVRVTADARPVVEGLMKAVEKLADGSTGFPPMPSDDMPKVPERKIAADVLIKNGTAQAITLDLAQFAEKPDASVHFPLRLAFTAGAPAVEAPAGATDFDLTAMEKAFQQMAEAGLDDGPGAGAPATPLTEAEYAKLAAAGIDRDKAKDFHEAGLSVEEMIELGDIIKG
ncbi:hypothetical protein [Kitasatospora sp. NPDC004531]